MKRTGWFVSFLFVLLAVFFVACFSLLGKIKPEPIQKIIVHTIEEATGSAFDFQSFELSYLPSLAVEFRGVKSSWPGKPAKEFHAQRVKVRLAPLFLLVGKVEISGVEVRGGQTDLIFPVLANKPLSVTGLDMNCGPLRSRIPIKIEAAGQVGPGSGRVSGKGTFRVERLGQWDWPSLEAQIFFSAKELEAHDVLNDFFRARAHLESVRGSFGFDAQFVKVGGDRWGKVDVDLEGQKFIYELRGGGNLLASPEIDFGVKSRLALDPEAEELMAESVTFTSPMGRVDVAGSVSLGLGEIEEMRINATDIVLESIPHYLVSLKEAIPFNIGFSGRSNFEMSLSGTYDHLSLQVNWDLTRSLLTYARYFSKPKDMPLFVTLDYLLKDNRYLSGDFSIHCKDVTLKGTLTDFDLPAREGQMNVITNKFQLAGWEALAPPLANFKVQGEMKVMANLKGNLEKLYETETMMNVTLANASFLSPEGMGISKLNLSADYGAVSLEVKARNFELGGAPVSFEMTAYNLSKEPKVEVKASSAKLEPLQTISVFSDFVDEWLSEDARQKLAAARSKFENVFKPADVLENLSTYLQYENRKWNINDLSFDAFDGKWTLESGLDFSGESPAYALDVDVSHLSLAKFGTRGGPGVKKMDGNLFLRARIQGRGWDPEWQKQLVGDGSFLITNGEFYTFDLFKAVAVIPDFERLSGFATGTVRFDDLNSKFSVSGGKVVTEKLLAVSRDFSVEGNGEISLDGALNYRLDVYLSSGVMSQIRTSEFSDGMQVERDLFWGPIPILLAGPLDSPELQPNPSLNPNLFDEIVKRQSRKPLTSFQPEELFFKDQSPR